MLDCDEVVTWRNEMSAGGAPFALVEERRRTFTGG